MKLIEVMVSFQRESSSAQLTVQGISLLLVIKLAEGHQNGLKLHLPTALVLKHPKKKKSAENASETRKGD